MYFELLNKNPHTFNFEILRMVSPPHTIRFLYNDIHDAHLTEHYSEEKKTA